MKRLLLLAIALVPLCVSAQQAVIPPSPEATSVFKFSEVPISTYTGLANVGVPLYEIKLKSMTIPIGISYHGRGVQVEEMGSRVGLGWALNYGGMLSRQIRGTADDGSMGGYIGFDDAIFKDYTLRKQWRDYVRDYNMDTEPDKYMFDMNGTSGNFIFNTGGTRQVLLQKYDDIKIVPVWPSTGPIRGWIATDKMGNKFYFGCNKAQTRDASDKDVTIGSYIASYYSTETTLPISGESDLNTWHLMEIETANNEKVEFFYDLELSNFLRRSFDETLPASSPTPGDAHSHYSECASYQYQIQRIEFDEGKVVFVPHTTERQDVLGGAYALDTVKVVNLQGKTLKSFSFNYQYTSATDTVNRQNHFLRGRDRSSDKRMFLHSVQEHGGNGELIPATSFEYNSTLLPNRFSNSQDNWGFYNGKNNGEYLTFMNYGTITPNREVDTVLSEAGLLEKMKLPTGGSVKFTYEHNIAKTPPFMNELFYPNNNPSTTVPVFVEMLKHPSYWDATAGMYKLDVTIDSTITSQVTFQITLPYCADSTSGCYYHAKIIGPGGYDVTLYPPQTGPHLLTLSPGNYELQVIPTGTFDPTDFHNTFFATLAWTTHITSGGSGGSILYAAGKRIKKIEYQNADGTLLQKSYRYTLPTGTTSGEIFGLPNFYFVMQVDLGGGITGPGLPQMSGPGSPFTSLQGNSLGYGFVTEYFGTPDTNQGKIEYQYTTTPDAGKYYEYPYTLPVDCEWLRGKNLSTSVYANTSSGYVLKKNTSTDYIYSGAVMMDTALTKNFAYAFGGLEHTVQRKRFAVPLLTLEPIIHYPADEATLFYKTYYQTGGTFDTNSTIETSYEGSSVIKKQTNYYYDYDHTYQPIKVETLNSDGSTDGSYTSYPGNYPSGTAFIDSLVSKNVMAVPIEQVRYKDAGGTKTILSGAITTYKTTGAGLPDAMLKLENSAPIASGSFKFSNRSTGTLPPSGSQTAFSPDTRYYSPLSFDTYGGKGNPLQYTRKASETVDGPSTSYIWDYNEHYPLAEIKGAKQSDVAYTSFEDAATGNWMYTGTIVSTYKMTGHNCLSLGSSGGIAISGLNTTKTYHVLMWFRSSSSIAPGSGFTALYTLPGTSGWALYEKTFTGSTSFSFYAANGYIDEIRLCPIDALMTTYTYDPLVGMTSATDAKGRTSYFEYDGLQRLINVRDQDGNILKHTDYHFQNQ